MTKWLCELITGPVKWLYTKLTSPVEKELYSNDQDMFHYTVKYLLVMMSKMSLPEFTDKSEIVLPYYHLEQGICV